MVEYNLNELNDAEIVKEENPDIMSSLMSGDKIPLDVYEFLKKIANREIITMDLCQTLNNYINNRNELFEDNKEVSGLAI